MSKRLKDAIAVIYTDKGDSIVIYHEEHLLQAVANFADIGRTSYVFRKV